MSAPSGLKGAATVGAVGMQTACLPSSAAPRMNQKAVTTTVVTAHTYDAVYIIACLPCLAPAARLLAWRQQFVEAITQNAHQKIGLQQRAMAGLMPLPLHSQADRHMQYWCGTLSIWMKDTVGCR